MAKGKRGDWADRFRVRSDGKFRLKDVDPGSTPGVADRAKAEAELEKLQLRLEERQEVLYAQAKHAVLIVLQAMDTGGKDGTIRRVFGPLNPQGVRVSSFKAPTEEELAHDYLWRIHRETPAKGMIRIFNRSHYEDVLIVRVHDLVGRKEVERRYRQINDFEWHLVENNVTIVKIFLHISKREQKERLEARLDRPDKRWKFEAGDIAERKLWGKYMSAAETMFRRCSTKHAPWYVVPADHKWYRDLVVVRIALTALESLELKYPKPEAGLDEVVISD